MIRIGFGYDSHRFAERRALILCGLAVPYDKGLIGHSDADAGLHAVIDAALGAMGEGDIGTHFPDTEEAYKNADSMRLLERVIEMMKERGYTLNNCDVTIVCETPKLKDYLPAMRKNIAAAFGVTMNDVSVKAKTNEAMDAVGRNEGVVCYAALTLIRA